MTDDDRDYFKILNPFDILIINQGHRCVPTNAV
jgi:hypothetical protein